MNKRKEQECLRFVCDILSAAGAVRRDTLIICPDGRVVLRNDDACGLWWRVLEDGRVVSRSAIAAPAYVIFVVDSISQLRCKWLKSREMIAHNTMHACMGNSTPWF